jgi:hypothetical protein
VAKLLNNIFSKISSNKIGGLLYPTFLKKAKGAQTVNDPTLNRTNTDLTTLRTFATQKETIKNFIDNSPDLSLAAASLARFAITDSYTVMAFAMDGRIDVLATITAQILANRMDRMPTAYVGYEIPHDFRSLSERAIRQICICGSFGSELVLGKGTVPERVSIFSTRLLKFEERSGVVVPFIELNGERLYLDSPLAVIMDIDQDVESAYSTSYFNAATQPVLADFEFSNDLRRAFSKASLPRLSAVIDQEKWLAGLTADVRYDPIKLSAQMREMIETIQRELNGLEPQDAVVSFDTVALSHLSAGQSSTSDAAHEQRQMINARVAAGARTLPSILGRGENSTTSSTESMVYLRAVEGVQEKLNTMFSRHLTLGTRLMGHDCFVEFSYADPELRPKSELENFRVAKQSRVLEQLSLGLISDEEASIMITGKLPSGYFAPLSGTRFRDSAAATIAENPFSNTSVDGGASDTQTGKNQKAGDQQPKSNKTTGK